VTNSFTTPVCSLPRDFLSPHITAPQATGRPANLVHSR